MEAIAPPGIGALGSGVQVAERIDEARIEQIGELRALFVGKARVASVRARVLQVDLLMRYVEVAAHHHRLCVARLAVGQDALFQVLAHGAETIVPVHTVVKARQLALRVRRVHVNEPVPLELANDHASLGIKLGHSHFVNHAQGLFLAEHRRARIPLALGIAPILMVARKVHFDLTFLQLRFLQSEHVGVQLVESVHEALLHDGAKTVNVPRNQSHKVCLS